MNERDSEILFKMMNPMTAEEARKKYGTLERPKIIEVVHEDEDDLTDEEIDNLLDGQEDDTVDETEECYVNDYKPVNYSDKYDVILPDDFETWSNFAKTAWLKKQGCI